jgi:hypothetical protein
MKTKKRWIYFRKIERFSKPPPGRHEELLEAWLPITHALELTELARHGLARRRALKLV